MKFDRLTYPYSITAAYGYNIYEYLNQKDSLYQDTNTSIHLLMLKIENIIVDQVCRFEDV